MKISASFNSIAMVVLGAATVPVRSTESPSSVPSLSPSTAQSVSLVPSSFPSVASEPSEMPSQNPSSGSTMGPSSLPSQLPSNAPSEAPSKAPSEAPSKAPTPSSNVLTPVPSSQDIDIWSIVRDVNAEAHVIVSQEPNLFASVEMQYIVHNADQAEKVDVFLYPYEKCGEGAPSLLGSSEICVECASNTYTILIDDQVIINATFTLDDLASLEGTLWNSLGKTVQFCGRVALHDGSSDMMISYHDTEIELVIDLVTGFNAVGLDSAMSNPNSLFRNYSYQVASCLCQESTNECYSALPLFQMGSTVRVCVFPPSDDNAEIEKIVELELRQDATDVSRYAFLDGIPDGLSSVETATAEVYVVHTTLDARFFEMPENVSVFGLVLMKPTGSRRQRDRRLDDYPLARRHALRHLEPSEYENKAKDAEDTMLLRPQEDSTESGAFRLELQLQSEIDTKTLKQPWIISLAMVTIASALAVVVTITFWVYHQRRKTNYRNAVEVSGLV